MSKKLEKQIWDDFEALDQSTDKLLREWDDEQTAHQRHEFDCLMRVRDLLDVVDFLLREAIGED